MAALYDWPPVLFRIRGQECDWLFYEIDETDFSDGWLVCPMSIEEVRDLECGGVDVRSFFNNHREDCQIIYRDFATGNFFHADTVWNINDDLVWNRRLLPQTEKWFIDKEQIEYFDSTSKSR